jgi:hypothetical protein
MPVGFANTSDGDRQGKAPRLPACATTVANANATVADAENDVRWQDRRHPLTHENDVRQHV